MKRRTQLLLACLVSFTPVVLLTGCSGCGPTAKPIGEEEIEYFSTVAMGVEYGESEATTKKWAKDLRIEVSGDPTTEDSATIERVVKELNDLQDQVRLELVDEKPNMEMIFAPEAEFSKLEPNYQPTNYGFFWVNWDSNGEIYRARILISTEDIDQAERSHLIREELTQSLGLMRDSIRYPDSIFYANRTQTIEYAEIDKTLIKLLYMDAIMPNMTEAEVLEVLEPLKAPE